MILSETYVLRFGPHHYMTNSGCNGVTWVNQNPYRARGLTFDAAKEAVGYLAKGSWPFQEMFHIDPTMVEIVRLDGCGCCGRLHEIAQTVHGLRCDKHKGRNPCIIDGCGRTFEGKVGHEYICGKHFREAPKYMRDRLRGIERRAKKVGWTERLCGLHHIAWTLMLRSVREGRKIDIDEINRLMGWNE